MKKSFAVRARVVAPALSVLSIAFDPWAMAQDIEINPVVVSATRIPQSLSEVLTSTSVITRQEIEKSQATSLADLLQGESGFEFGRNGGPGTVTSFFLRGQDSVNTLVLIDGVRVQTDIIGAIQTTNFPLNQIEKIEILRGNASALYGVGAIGGVINIITREGKGAPKPYGSVTAGSYKTSGYFVGYGGETEDTNFNFNVGVDRSTGFSAMNTEQKKYANPDADGYKNEFAAFKFGKKITSDTKLGFSLNHSKQDAAYDSSYSWQDLPTDRHRLKKTNQSASGFLRHAFHSDWVSNLSLTRSEYKYEDNQNDKPWPVNGYQNSAVQGWQNNLSWGNNYQLNSYTKSAFGADLTDDTFSGIGSLASYDLKRRGRGYFVGLVYQRERLTLEGAARHDQFNVEKVNDIINSHYSANTVMLGLGYQMTEKWKFTGTLSTGFSVPTADAVGANPQIKPEHHHSSEYGAVYQTSSTLVRAVYFQTQAKDAIIYNNAYNYVNSDIKNQGFELTTRAKVGLYSIKSSLTLQDPRDISQQLDQARRAKHYGSVDLSRSINAYEVGSRVYASGARPESNFNPGVILPGYSIVTFYVSRKMNDDWTGRIKLENAFDRAYQLAYGYNTPGRGVYATLQYQPK